MPGTPDWVEYTGTKDKDKPFLILENGAPKVLTGWTITLKAWLEEDDSVLAFSGTCTPIEEASGTCKYTFVDGNITARSSAGTYLVILELVSGSSLVPTNIKRLEVKAGAPAS